MTSPTGARPVPPDNGPPVGFNRVEYALMHDNGEDDWWLAERPCGCVHTFSSAEDLMAYYNLEVTDTVMRREVPLWLPWEGRL